MSLGAVSGIADRGRGPRLAAVDLARGVAIAAMVVYHAGFDLSAERLIPVSVVDDPAWRISARIIAGTFLLLVGVSLTLAARSGIKRRAFLRRLGLISGGAALVSLGTFWFDSATFVFFGILHQIAVASVLALPFLRLRSGTVAAASMIATAAPWFATHPFFDTPALWWVGLSTEPPVTVDYVPIFPWFGVVLAGIVVGRLLVRYGGGLWSWQPDSRAARWTMTAGRWSLPIYLVHQPLLVGAVAVLAAVLPPNRAFVEANWTAECRAACVVEGRAAEDCFAPCACLFDGLYGTDLFKVRSVDAMNGEQSQRWDVIFARCVPPESID